MRNFFIIGMLMVGMFMAGWFTINRQGDRTTIEINKNEIREDTRKAINRGREFLDSRDQEQTQVDESQWAQQQQQPGPYQQDPYGAGQPQYLPGYLPQDQVTRQPEWQQAAQPPYLNQQNYRQPYDNRQFDQQQYYPQQEQRAPLQQNYYPPQTQQYPIPGSR